MLRSIKDILSTMAPGTAQEDDAVSLEELFSLAHTLKKGSWRSYSKCKRILCKIPLSQDEYDMAVRALVDILQV